MDTLKFFVISFGLTKVLATFMHLMHSIFHEHLDTFIVIFLDNILIYSRTLDAYIEYVKKALQILPQHQLYCKPSKCPFFQHLMEYLGHIL